MPKFSTGHPLSADQVSSPYLEYFSNISLTRFHSDYFQSGITPEREITRTRKKIRVSNFSMRNTYMKFQNRSMHGSLDMACIKKCDRWNHARTENMLGGWYLPIYGVVRMCGPNSPLFQLGKYMNGPIFSAFGIWIAPFFELALYNCSNFTLQETWLEFR